MDYAARSLQLHAELHGPLELALKVRIKTKDDLSTFYTPGIAAVSRELAEHPRRSFELTMRGNAVAVISDGSAVLGLGNIGPYGAAPVMGGKALLFKALADIDAYPLVLDTQDPAAIIAAVRAVAPNFAGINLEDIAAPACFEIEDALQDLGIPVMHDDQHGTAAVVLAALLNALKVTGRSPEGLRVAMVGAGAAGTAVAMTLLRALPDVALRVVDSKGILSPGREGQNQAKEALAAATNSGGETGGLADALRAADVFVGLSAPGILTPELIGAMAPGPVIFALANPEPEIRPEAAVAAGAALVATGRSDFPNQVNNALMFPGLFRGALDAKATKITPGMRLAASRALAALVPEPAADRILPDVLDPRVVPAVASATAAAARVEGVSRG